jgi:hypothetical protein
MTRSIVKTNVSGKKALVEINWFYIPKQNLPGKAGKPGQTIEDKP